MLDSSTSFADVLAALGIKVANLAAGAAGGLVRALHKRVGLCRALALIATGGLTAAFIGEPVAHAINGSVGLFCFVIGYGGMVLLEEIIDRTIKRWQLPPT